MSIAYLSLGSNLNNPINQVISAISEISSQPNIKLLAQSSLYETPPIGPKQPNFINAALKIETNLSADQLLQAMQKIEQDHQRQRTIHWGPRTLDIDLLLFDNLSIDKNNLTIPHPFLAERAFVLVPLLEIEADLTTPQHGKLQNCLIQLEDRFDIKAISTLKND